MALKIAKYPVMLKDGKTILVKYEYKKTSDFLQRYPYERSLPKIYIMSKYLKHL